MENAVANAMDAKRAWIKTALKAGVEINESDSLETYSGQFKLFTEDEELRTEFESLYDINVFDDNFQLTNEAYEKFYSWMIVNAEQVYDDIFIENHLNTTFLSDIKAMNWFLHRCK